MTGSGASGGPAPRRLEAALAVVLGVAVALAYLPVVSHSFTNYDDDSYVWANANVASGLTLRNLAWAASAVVVSNWHPLTMVSHQADATIFGLRPGGHHATSAAIHVANAVLLFLLLSRATAAPRRAFLVAALFGLHPLNVEAVAWVAQRKTVLSFLFCLLALIPYASWARAKRGRSYAAVMALFAAALLSKPSAVVFPAALLALDFWPLGRAGEGGERWRGLVLEKVPLAVLSAGAAAVTLVSQGHTGAIQSAEVFPISMRAANAVHATAAYLGKALWPSKLAIFFPHPLGSLSWPSVLLAGLAVAGACAAAYLGRKRFPQALAGWGWYLVWLVPVLGLVQVGSLARADRYAYVPLIGIFAGAVFGLDRIARGVPWGRRAGAVAAIVVLAALFASTRHHLGAFQDSETLFRAALRVTEGNYVAHANLGHALVARGALDEAIRHFERAAAIAPRYAVSHVNLGSALCLSGDLERGIAEYREAVRLDPGDLEVRYHLGRALFRAGKGEEAVAALEAAAERAPGRRDVLNDLGWVLFRLGRLDEAEARLREAAGLAQDARVERNLGAVLLASGEREEGIARYRRALELDPGFAEARAELEAALSAEGAPATPGSSTPAR